MLTGPLESTNEWYAVAKIAGIKMCQAYRRQYGCNYISLMPTNLYGPGDDFDLQSAHVIPALMRKLHEGKVSDSEEVVVWGTGTPKREFLHVDDLADAAVYLMETYSGEEHVNVGTGRDISISELAQMLKEVTGFGGILTYDRSKPDGTPRKLLDVARLNRLGWRAKIKLRAGLADTYRWFVRPVRRELKTRHFVRSIRFTGFALGTEPASPGHVRPFRGRSILMATRGFMGIRKRIKFVSKNSIEPGHFSRLPNRHPEMEFILDPTTRAYDWFVVYDDLPRARRERFSLGSESLACPPENTILLTYEPSSVKYYGDDYANQFAYVLTSHEPTMLSHAARHDAPPVGKWYYGGVGDALGLTCPPQKGRQICIFLSTKRMGHTLHRKTIRLSGKIDTTSAGT